ncbi:MAG: class I SAM-dependent methyltransferase [SAR202 cluster bacterium]|nr:hypothetical protein [Verrucomicrobiales bacterium]MQG34748.1 class I SAM-dependent methyltransferase [SAR202 cluster bacterium]
MTALDYSPVAIEKGRQLAAEQGVNVEFIVGEASEYRPSERFDLITSFYIQLFPAQRANMLASMSDGLAPGGTLLFVSHDKSGPPEPLWSARCAQSDLGPAASVPGSRSRLEWGRFHRAAQLSPFFIRLDK